MGINIYNIKRWMKMLSGKSIYHVEQNIGKLFKEHELKGYFNDLTNKVILGNGNLDNNGIPFLEHSDGSKIQMSTMILQYGLGAYDLWLLEKKKEFLNKALICAEWAVKNQEINGAWDTFSYIYPNAPYSAMPQGEGISLMVRLYKETNNEKYLLCAKKAIEFMLKDIKDGGVCDYSNGELQLLEYTHLPIVMNGWIFALFGIYDFFILTGEYKEEFEQTVNSLEKKMPLFDAGYWSMYDLGNNIASPFYHDLHIAQMQALYKVTKINTFYKYQEKFILYKNNGFNRKKAFFVKALQKIME